MWLGYRQRPSRLTSHQANSEIDHLKRELADERRALEHFKAQNQAVQDKMLNAKKVTLSLIRSS